MATSWRYWAPVIVPDQTGTALVVFEQWSEASPLRIDRWPVVAWLISVQQHSDDDSRRWANPEPITTNGIIHERTIEKTLWPYQLICLEMGSSAGGRIWRFRNGTTFLSLERAQAYATEELAEYRRFANQDLKRAAAKRGKERRARAARRARREQQKAAPLPMASNT